MGTDRDRDKERCEDDTGLVCEIDAEHRQRFRQLYGGGFCFLDNAPTSPPHSRQTPNTLPSTTVVLLKKISLVCEVVIVNILFIGCVIGSARHIPLR